MRMGSQWGTELSYLVLGPKGIASTLQAQILSNIIKNDVLIRTVIIIPVIRVGTRKRLGIVLVSVVVQDGVGPAAAEPVF